MITYIVSGVCKDFYTGSNFYVAVEMFKWAVANGYHYVELKETEDGCHYESLKIFCN